MVERNQRGLLHRVALWTRPVRYEIHQNEGEQRVASYPTIQKAEEEAIRLVQLPDKPDFDFYSVHSLWGQEYRKSLIIKL